MRHYLKCDSLIGETYATLFQIRRVLDDAGKREDDRSL